MIPIRRGQQGNQVSLKLRETSKKVDRGIKCLTMYIITLQQSDDSDIQDSVEKKDAENRNGTRTKQLHPWWLFL